MPRTGTYADFGEVSDRLSAVNVALGKRPKRDEVISIAESKAAAHTADLSVEITAVSDRVSSLEGDTSVELLLQRITALEEAVEAIKSNPPDSGGGDSGGGGSEPPPVLAGSTDVDGALLFAAAVDTDGALLFEAAVDTDGALLVDVAA